MVFRGVTNEDLPTLKEMWTEAHKKMRLPYSASETWAVFLKALDAPSPVIKIAENGCPCGYIWAEPLITKELFIYQAYMREDAQSLANYIDSLSKSLGCQRVIGISYRPGAKRGFLKYGYKPVATVVSKEI